MNISDIIIYTFSGSICLSMGLYIIFIHDNDINTKYSFREIKLPIAVGAFIQLISNVVALTAIINGHQSELFDKFIYPITHYAETILFAYALLRLINSNIMSVRLMLGALTPSIILCLIYLGTYIAWGINSGFSYASYSQFGNSTVAITTEYIACAFALISMATLIFILPKEILNFLRNVDNFFTGDDIKQNKWLGYLTFLYTSLLIISSINYILSNPLFNRITTALSSILFIIFTIMLINIKMVYLKYMHSTKERAHSNDEHPKDKPQQNISTDS